MIECNELPKTSQINSYRFEKVFKKITEKGDSVLVITISSKLSGTFNSAKTAAKAFKGKVFVVDSLNACIGERILVQYACRLINQGMGAMQIAEALEEAKKKVHVLGVLDTLKFLKKGGRISLVTAVAGELLKVKPVVSLIDGEVKLVGKAIGSKKGNNLLMQLVQKTGGINFDMPYAVAYSGLDDSYLKKYLADSAVLWQDHTNEVPCYTIGSTIGTHLGPGAIAVAYFSK